MSIYHSDKYSDFFSVRVKIKKDYNHYKTYSV